MGEKHIKFYDLPTQPPGPWLMGGCADGQFFEKKNFLPHLCMFKMIKVSWAF